MITVYSENMQLVIYTPKKNVDQDPIFREATARAGIRDFALALEEHFPGMRAAIAEHFSLMGAQLSTRTDNQRPKSAATTIAGGAQSAENRKAAGVAGG
ncbi:MAG: hypothetical protein AAGF90_10150 [Pseudomonadota bacterium]